MKLYINNVEKGKVSIADTFFKRFRGFMFYKEPYVDFLVIKPCNSIHMFFMKFSIDVLFVDKEGRVVANFFDLKRNKLASQKNAEYVIEGRSGSFVGVNISDKVEIY